MNYICSQIITAMEDRIDYSKMPDFFLMCLNKECAKADNCLRQLAVQGISAEVRRWTVLSPKYLATLTGDCPYYKVAERTRYAKGFTKMLNDMPHRQMGEVVRSLIKLFGERTYYRVRKGERLLSPAEQQSMLDIVGRCGISQPQEFNEYVDDYDWT